MSNVSNVRLLSSLAPKINDDLAKGLNEYRLLLRGAERAIELFDLEDFEQFDPNVGENACQIRAVKIALMAKYGLVDIEKIKGQISQAKRIVSESLQNVHVLKKQKKSMKDLMQDKSLQVMLSSEEFFAIQTFLLTFTQTLLPYKSDTPLLINGKNDPKKLKEFEPSVSSSFTDNLVRKLRQDLAAASVEFVRDKAAQLKDPTLIKMSSEPFTLNYNSWLSIPMFWTYKTLLLTCEEEGIPLTLIAKFLDKHHQVVREESLFLTDVDPSKGLRQSSCVIEGSVCCEKDLGEEIENWRALIKKRGKDVVLAGAADHRQYPDESVDERVKVLKDKEFENYQALAQKEGYSLNNPSSFFIQHIYPATVGRLVLNAFTGKKFPQKIVKTIGDYVGNGKKDG